MKAVTVKAGSRVLYVEESCIEEIVMEPEIYKVPQSDKNIAGIDLYEGKLVVYYQFGHESSARCGVILKVNEGFRIGIAADEASVITTVDQEGIMPVVYGVWERKSD